MRTLQFLLVLLLPNLAYSFDYNPYVISVQGVHNPDVNCFLAQFEFMDRILKPRPPEVARDAWEHHCEPVEAGTRFYYYFAIRNLTKFGQSLFANYVKKLRTKEYTKEYKGYPVKVYRVEVLTAIHTISLEREKVSLAELKLSDQYSSVYAMKEDSKSLLYIFKYAYWKDGLKELLMRFLTPEKLEKWMSAMDDAERIAIRTSVLMHTEDGKVFDFDSLSNGDFLLNKDN